MISLYEATVPSFIQIVSSVQGLLSRAQTHYTEKGLDTQELLGLRLVPDMLPFQFQISSVISHSIKAIEAARAGVFSPDPNPIHTDFGGMQHALAQTIAQLQALSADEVNALQGRDVTFQLREFKIPFLAEGFLLSFSLPNFYFHATTAYDILRLNGVQLGKRDYLGQMRTKK